MINKKVILELVKYTAFFGSAWFIVIKLSNTEFSVDQLSLIDFWPYLLLVMALMPLNWFLESWRWRTSVPFENLSTRQAIDVVLRGLALNWVVPLTGGDFISRVVETKNKKMSMLSIAFNRISILLITTIFGGLSLLFYFKLQAHLAFFSIAVALLILIIVFLILRKSLFGVDNTFMNFRLGFKVLSITILRYAIFTFQFYLLFSYFIPDLPAHILLLGIGWIFLFRSIIPSILGNLGVREASSIIFFEPYVVNLSMVLLPCLLIWLINTVMPSLIGLISIIKFRYKLAQ